MIYVPTPSAAVTLRIPRTCSAPYAGAVLTVRSTVGLREAEIPLVSLDASDLYFVISADFSAANVPGEYEYRLAVPDAILATGVLAVGELPDVDRMQYDKSVQYEQYDAR